MPTGTVSLLFSDVEGSTLLLQRLGPAYAEAVDGQRQVQRKAWVEHGGTELGTEGDSFYVVFPTAEGAVKAATQAQRELAAFEWPGGERVRVRMGIHTGAPTPHDGAYVGMDVHRAARIAGAAHGGQVLVSSATAELASECLPDGVALKDLGRHQLKDIPTPERLLQLAIEDLQADFPPVKTLGASSSLPRPATPLVGRDGELAELTALLSAPEVRLVTLTGPGGSGKTRLAIGIAERLVERFPDGVYFVPLATFTTADVMWTSIAEVLDVPPEGRLPPGFFDHVAHRTALFVLDNLEQIDGADTVVAELLDHAPQAVAVATSRKPLAVPAEHVHPVPPLKLPEGSSQADAEASGAVQLFVQHAQKVKPAFRLTTRNAPEVTEICRRLDGLPLAIELAAARARVLSPAALLGRLDKALDIAASGHQAPSRQKTLRDTIGWSYQLLSPTHQAFFRRLGVFSGGADLEAGAAVAADILGEADPFDLAVDLVDANLATITDDEAGEPRIGMLQTIRSYAQDQLRAEGDATEVSRAHALHYLNRAEGLSAQLKEGSRDRVMQGQRRFELEIGNYREALSWALATAEPLDAPSADRASIGLKLCAELSQSWWDGGYFSEARQWLAEAIRLATDAESVELARCLWAMSAFMSVMGEQVASHEAATRSVAICRRIGDTGQLPTALTMQGRAARAMGELQMARQCFEEAIAVARATDDQRNEAEAMNELAVLEFMEGNLERRLGLEEAVVAINKKLGDDLALLSSRHNLACTLRLLGRLDEAEQTMREVIPQAVLGARSEGRTSLAEDYAALMADLGHHERAARLIGAADASRQRDGTHRNPAQEAEVEKPFAETRAALPVETWDREYRRGHAMTVEDALTEAHAATAHLTD